MDSALSPFLQRYKDSKVKWRAFSPETLAEAEAADKPIFLSIGDASCHWCHVMAKDSFDNDAMAAMLNTDFIPVLVDKLQRPDLDQLYQAAGGLMGFSGGWPLTMFLTTKGAPWMCVGYVPQEPRGGNPGFGALLDDAKMRWEKDRATVENSAVRMCDQIENFFNRDMSGSADAIQLDLAAMRIGQRFDIFNGGFSGFGTNLMKFPSVPLVQVLWRAYLRSSLPQFLQLVSGALDHMLMGGLYDHLGGGFFRHTTDEAWQMPHFEKTLSENALQLELMTELWQFNRNDLCGSRIEGTVEWLMREMKLPGGGFAANLDSDTNGDSGVYYMWSEAEIDAVLTGTFSQRFKSVYTVSKDGVYGSGWNVLRRQIMAGNQLSAADEALMAKQRALLLIAREKRTRPLRNDLLLADANGMMIAALAQAGMSFERADWGQAAGAAYDHVVKTLGDGDILYHSDFDGKRGARGFADDYANMARAALILWEATGEKRFLDDAKRWTEALDKKFWDKNRGGYCTVADDADKLVVRIRSIYDLPVPSANSTMVSVLTRLALITGEEGYGNRARNILGAFVDEINRSYITAGATLTGLENFATGFQTVVVGPRDNIKTQELLRAIWGRALPYRLIYQVDDTADLPPGHPAYGKPMQSGQPTVYLCQRTTCAQPITSPVVLAQALTLPAKLLVGEG